MNHRDRSFLDLAHGLHMCTVQIPGVCQGYVADGLEPAHSNQALHGKGKGLKAHDVFHAAACHACHAEIDQPQHLSRSEAQAHWQRGFEVTVLEYVMRGWIGVTK